MEKKPETGLANRPDPVRVLAQVKDDSSFAMLLDSDKFSHLQRVAGMYANSSLVPTHYQNNMPNCAIAMQMAMRLNVDPFMFMQKTYIIQGKLGMEAQLAIALVNSRGPFTGPIQYKMEGDGRNRSCTAYATHKVTGEVCSATVPWAMVEAEGWSKKSGSKWQTMPDMMFWYRAATFLARLYCPEVLMGMATTDELEDILPAKHVSATVTAITQAEAETTDRVAALGDRLTPAQETTIDKETGEELPFTTPETAPE